MTVTLEPPEGAAAAFRPTYLMERISRALEAEPGPLATRYPRGRFGQVEREGPRP